MFLLVLYIGFKACDLILTAVEKLHISHQALKAGQSYYKENE